MFNAQVDLAKLPAGKDPKSVLLTGAHLAIDINLKGIKVEFKTVSNPNARQFENGQAGLKEWLDKLIARDKETLTYIGLAMGYINDFATDIVTPKASAPAITPPAYSEPQGHIPTRAEDHQ